MSGIGDQRAVVVCLGLWASALCGCQGLSYEGQVGSVPDERVIARFCLNDGDLDRLHGAAGLTNEELMRLPLPTIEKTLRKLDRPRATGGMDAARWRLSQRVDEHGEIPDGALMRAKAQRELMMQTQRAVPALDWEWMGPGNIGGRTRSLVISPVNPQVMYAGGVTGGVWKSTNGGAYWQPLNDFLPSLAIGDMHMDREDPNVLYVGTGEGHFGNYVRGAGIFKTVNGGVTFTQLPSTTDPNFHFVNRIDFAAGSSTLMLVATNTGIFRSDDAGASFTRQSFDRAIDIDFHPTDPLKAVAGRDHRASYTTDGGLTWQDGVGIPTGGGRVETAYARSNPSVVYASAQTWGLYRSDDGGQTYVQVTSETQPGAYLAGQGLWSNALWVDPTDPDTVVIGGVDLWRSTNAGASFDRISLWQFAPSSAHADQHAIVEHPDFDGVTNTQVYFTNDGGIYETDDVYSVIALQGWQELNNNYGVTQFYSGGGNSSGKVLGGTQDNGTLVYQGDTETWTAMIGGDGSAVGADKENVNYLYAATQWGYLFRSAAGGAFPTAIFEGIEDLGTPYEASASNFITPYILDPNQSQRLLWGGARLWRTEDARALTVQWSEIKPATRSVISAIAVAPGDSDKIWVGYNSGQISRTVNGTDPSPVWQSVSTGLPSRFVTSIAIDPNDHDRVYVTLGGFSEQNVWRSDVGGGSWVSISGAGGGALPELPVKSIVIDDVNDNVLYIGTELGVFGSDNDGLTWTTSNLGPANTLVDQLFWWLDENDDRWLVAATHGRGMFRADTVTPCRADFDGDGQVGSTDLSILIGSWGLTDTPVDIDDDGAVGSSDLAALLGSWGPCP